MEFVNIAEVQLEKGVQIAFKEFPEFFSEYFKVMENEKEFHSKIPGIVEKTNKEETLRNISILEKTAKEVEPIVKLANKENRFPGIVFFIGLNNFDGHGFLVSGKPYAFFNMTRMNQMMRLKRFSTKTHLAHETFHALHYFYSPEFYPKKDIFNRKELIKKIIAEGIATYLSKKALKTSDADALWFGLLDEKDVSEWIKNCKRSLKEVQDRLNTHIDESFFLSLFTVSGMDTESLKNGRCGYCYGTEIAELAAAEYRDSEILEFTFKEFEKYAERYFENTSP